MQDDRSEPGPETPFGEALLDALRTLGMPMTGLSYAEIQELKSHDRDGAIRMLRQNSVSLSYAMIQIMKTKSPEEIAQLIHAQQVAAMARAGNVMPVLMLLTMM